MTVISMRKSYQTGIQSFPSNKSSAAPIQDLFTELLSLFSLLNRDNCPKNDQCSLLTSESPCPTPKIFHHPNPLLLDGTTQRNLGWNLQSTEMDGKNSGDDRPLVDDKTHNQTTIQLALRHGALITIWNYDSYCDTFNHGHERLDASSDVHGRFKCVSPPRPPLEPKVRNRLPCRLRRQTRTIPGYGMRCINQNVGHLNHCSWSCLASLSK